MAAASVVFSFTELSEKLGQPSEFIHAPVPGYREFLRKSTNLAFEKLKPHEPVWRNNWGIGPDGEMDKPIYGSTSTLDHRTMTNVTVDDIKRKYLKVEYETLSRFDKTGYLLFTVKSHADPMTCLEHVPSTAAACLARSIRGMSKNMHKYKGIENEETCSAVLEYLDGIVAKDASA